MSAQSTVRRERLRKNNHLQSGYNCGFAGDFMFFIMFRRSDFGVGLPLFDFAVCVVVPEVADCGRLGFFIIIKGGTC